MKAREVVIEAIGGAVFIGAALVLFTLVPVLTF